MDTRFVDNGHALSSMPLAHRHIQPKASQVPALAVTWFAALGLCGLHMPDERLYAEHTREMRVIGDLPCLTQ
jgi:hypothetical protein